MPGLFAALVAHFDCTFGSSHTSVEFSTGPQAPYTHWKQTVFYLNEVLTVKQGEVLTGTIECAPNAKNPRDLDIVIEYQFDGEITQSSQRMSYRMR